MSPGGDKLRIGKVQVDEGGKGSFFSAAGIFSPLAGVPTGPVAETTW